MTLLLPDERIDQRRAAARGGLAPLAASLAVDLETVLRAELVIPREKARLTRAGGRCPRDATLLAFDPWSPRRHRCPTCGAVYDDEAHYRWWIVWFQLWLAERTVHAALLHLLAPRPALAAFADDLLERYASMYLAYPNRDNVLGPTRPFFSTYLESIWLLQLTIALDLREAAGASPALVSVVRERVIEPSARLIASYDEGASNRQVWNNAALLCAGRSLGDDALADAAVWGGSGLVRHLGHSLLADGSWYEGENYHLFAHRGLWYGVVACESAAIELPPALVRRFDEGFATPFLTALPDFTFPSRRDSQYAISLRQWRFAELCELGLARGDDRRLSGALATLYDADIPRGDTGRSRSTAESERNEPPTALGRADLGWRSLLHARAELPQLIATAPRSALLAEQGFAVMRRDEGRVYVALDYGHSGGGHGHPDRLGLLLVDGTRRWLDDMGTGSYVDRSLHWYRSTLAHNAPLVGGRSQLRVHGTLNAYDERGGAGWVEAEADGIAPGVRVRRTVVVMPNYLVDEVEWRGAGDTTFDLPFHADGELTHVGAWSVARPEGGMGEEDGFPFLEETGVTRQASGAPVTLRAGVVRGAGSGRVSDEAEGTVAWLFTDSRAEWWRATAPGAPGRGIARFYFVRVRAPEGSVRTLWSWNGSVAGVTEDGRSLVVELPDESRHVHTRTEDGWHVELEAGGGRSSIDLGGRRTPSDDLRGAGDSRDEGAPHAAHTSREPSSPSSALLVPQLGEGVGGGDSSGSARASVERAPAENAADERAVGARVTRSEADRADEDRADTGTGDDLERSSSRAPEHPDARPRSVVDDPRRGGPPAKQDSPGRAIQRHPRVAPRALDAHPALEFRLGEAHYRRSEPSWREAGAPAAVVRIAAVQEDLVVDVDVAKRDLAFAPARDESPLDNEHPDIDGDGVQLHLAVDHEGRRVERAWLLVPDESTGGVRVTSRLPDEAPVAVAATWHRSATGYRMLVAVSLAELRAPRPLRPSIDVIVNDGAPDRERRRGQLVLSGARGEYVYLRGDRQPADRFLPLLLAHV